MKRIAIHGKAFQEDIKPSIEELFKLLDKAQCVLEISSEYVEQLKIKIAYQAILKPI